LVLLDHPDAILDHLVASVLLDHLVALVLLDHLVAQLVG
jgi:hypothetical protein